MKKFLQKGLFYFEPGVIADAILEKNIKIGFYTVMNLYMKKFYSTTEAGYSSVLGVNLIVLF